MLGIFYERNYSTHQLLKMAGIVSSRLVEVNGILGAINSNKSNLADEWKKYNKDMLLLIDCSGLLEKASSLKSSSEIVALKKSIDDSLKILDTLQVKKQDLTLCDKLIFKLDNLS